MIKKGRRKIFFYGLVILFILLVIDEHLVGQDKVKRSNIKKINIPILEKISTNIEKPMELRDPFKKPILDQVKKSIMIQNRPYWMENGVITNIGGKAKPKEININDLVITGVLLGSQRRVMVSVGGTQIVLKEGMKFGPDMGIELKAILPAGIVFVEKIKNVYEQDEYIETIIPIKEGGLQNQ